MKQELWMFQTQICYFLLSLITSIFYFIETASFNAAQVFRALVSVLALFSLNYKESLVPAFIFLHKVSLLFCAIYSSQPESLLQLALDTSFIDHISDLRLRALTYAFHSAALPYITYQNNQQSSLQTTAMIVPFQVVGSLLFSIYHALKSPPAQVKTQREIVGSTDRDYHPIGSPREEGEGHAAADIRNLIHNISSNQDQQYITHQIQIYQESVWQTRMNAMPIGIAIVNSKFEVRFMNCALINILNKNFYADQANLNQILMEQLQFKRIDNGWNLTDCRRQSGESESFALRTVLERLLDGSLANQVNVQEHTLELFSSFESAVNRKQIFLDCRVLTDEIRQPDYLIIVQDFTKQNELSKLEEQNQFKTKVIQSFSHELRTPLNSALMFLRCALQDPQISEALKDAYLMPCQASLKLQNNLINDIIDFSHINAKLLELRFNTFSLASLIDEITEQFKLEFHHKSIGLAFDVDQSVPDILKSDYQRLLQVLTNIIQNALKFSEKGYVVVRIRAGDPHELVFTVQDEGVGLSRESVTQLQSIINQEQQYKMTQQWHGFGLVICQMLLRYLSPMQNSNLLITSDGNDCGTKVQFTISNHLQSQTNEYPHPIRRVIRQSSLPLLKASYGLFIHIQARSPSKIILNRTELEEPDSSLPSIKNDSRDRLSKYKMNCSSIQKLNSQHTTSQLTSQPMLSPMRNNSSQGCCLQILSADDEVFNQKSLQLLLKQSGIELHLVFNGKQALEKILHPKKCCSSCPGFRMILMDCQMPIIDGWQATIRLREMMVKEKTIPTIPIIGLTAFTSSADIQKCTDVGMNEVLHKPLDVKKFLQICSKFKITI